MAPWCVLLYYSLLLILTLFIRYVICIRWWSSFILALVVTYLVIIFTGPELSDSNDQQAMDLIYMFLLYLLAILSPILIFIYVASQAFYDQIMRVCVVTD